MDAIVIRGLRLETRIGVTEQERSHSQFVLVSLQIDADLDRARSTDDVADTIDYHRVVKEIGELVRSSNVHLLEHLGERIVGRIAQMNGVSGVTVEIAKESPPVGEDVAAISVKVGKR